MRPKNTSGLFGSFVVGNMQCVGHRECVIYPLLSRATTFPVPKQQHKLRVAEYLQKISVEFSFLWFVVSNT